MLLRFSLYNSIVSFVAAYLIIFQDAINFLWIHDPTRVTFIIAGIYILMSVYIGAYKDKVKKDFINFVANTLTSIGLTGTVIGIMILMNAVGNTTHANSSDIIGPLILGYSTVLVTTLSGILFSLLLKYEMAFCFGSYSE